MSSVHSVHDFVDPVPEPMLAGKTAREQNEVARGHRAYTRLASQEANLAQQAYLVSAVGEQKVPKPHRRVPAPPSHATVTVRIPKSLKALRGGGAATSGSGGAAAPPPAAASLSTSVGARAQAAGESFAKSERLATVKLAATQRIKNMAPTERIALLYTPTANVRTVERNDAMRAHDYDVTYRGVEPPKAPAPGLTANDVGVRGRDPALSHFLPLEDFDNNEYERMDPKDWIEIGRGHGGTPARSRYIATGPTLSTSAAAGTNGALVTTAAGALATTTQGAPQVASTDEVATWLPCRVLDYDEVANSFLVAWNHSGKQKWTKRLNLLFDDEDEAIWQERVAVAEELRRSTEADIRLHLFIEGMDQGLVAPVDEDQIDRVLSLVATEFPLQHLHVIEKCVEAHREMHAFGCRKAIQEYNYRSAEERQRLAALGFRQPPPAPMRSLDSLLGTIDTPSPNFHEAKSYVAENLFQAHALLYPTLHTVHGRWHQFADHLLCDGRMKSVLLPCHLHVFEEVQNRVGSFTSERLRDDWSVNVVTTIQNDLDVHFNFYEEKIERYKTSRMYRFCRMVNIMMSSQLRQLLVASIKSYTDFISRYRVMLAQDFDIDADTIDEIDGDRVERLHWEQRAEEVVARRTKEREEREAKEKKGKKKKVAEVVVADGEEGAEGEEGDKKPKEQPPLEFDFFLNPAPYSARILEMTRQPNGLEPLFVVELISNGDAVMYQPLLEEVEDKVKGVFDNFFVLTDQVKGLGDQLFPLLGLPPFFLKLLDHSDPVVLEGKEVLHRTLLENMQGPRQLQQLYQSFEYILKCEIDSLVDSFTKRQPPQSDFDNALERLYRDMDRIRERTLNSVKFEMIKVECGGIKSSLLRKANEIAAALMDVLAQQLNQQTLNVVQRYDRIYHNILVEPQTPEELQKLKQYVDGIGTEMSDLWNSLLNITSGYDLLAKFKYEVETGDFHMYWVAYEKPRKVQQALEDFEMNYKKFRNAFQQDLRENCENLTKQIASVAAKVEELATRGDETQADLHEEFVDSIDKELNDIREKIALFNSHEVLFGQPVTQWSHVRDIRTAFEPYQVLWKVTASWNVQSEAWMTRPLSDLNPEQVDKDVNEWFRKLTAVSKKIKDELPLQACLKVKEAVDKFRPYVPLIKAMRSNLQPSSVRQIGMLVNEKELTTEGKTLTQYLNMGLLTHIVKIEEIAEVAEKTHALNKQLDTMRDAWNRVSLMLEQYNDTYKLKASDELQQLLDDHIQKTQLILSSPFAKTAGGEAGGGKGRFENKVTDWAEQLNLVQSTLDEWFRCQNTWAYLEPIFASPDIAKALPESKEKFDSIDKSWKEIMATTKVTHQVLLRAGSKEDPLLYLFKGHNDALDEIKKKLQQYLETKRMAFPRFYFISNEELIQILSDSKDPYRVQPYLASCFEGITRIRFQDSMDITAMESAEQEVVPFCRKVNPADHQMQVEYWLGAVESVMLDSVKDQIKKAKEDYRKRPRIEFIRHWPGQVVIAVCSMYWTMEATEAMVTNGHFGLESYYGECKKQLDDLVLLVRDKTLSVVQRCTLEALVVIEVHSRDITGELAHKKIESPTAFDWLAQLRYYWDDTDNHLKVKQINATLTYGYEYLGNTGRLVITQLTDRCYRTLMGALHLNYGGAPEGPAGTGKTETVKDLAKALGKRCVVYNCSDQITYKDMAKLFKGLSQVGAWGCFDEFNRIEIQVLSVIAQQVATIQEAIKDKRVDFWFDDATIKLKMGCAVFITMNPGYAGRSDLPDNLKALFRPVAMMVPNYAMIGEIQLYSFGFLEGRVLSEKIVATYKLCSEQLSSQNHYDYGMRAVKAVLTAAGRLKRQFPDDNEHILMLRSIKDVNLPKFLADDVELFEGIISDLFPGVELPKPNYDAMREALTNVCRDDKLQLTPYFSDKLFQTYEMILVRHGMMVVGKSLAGKSKMLQSLAKSLTAMHKKGMEQKTRLIIINPKSITLGQLYGKVDVSGEWIDGVLSKAFQLAKEDNTSDRKWLVLDGPVDAVWIENMNTVLDDNKRLCLTNGTIIPMTPSMNMIFEVQDLEQASPATVSRCGMVFVEPEAFGWRPMVESFILNFPALLTEADTPFVEIFRALVDIVIEPMLTFVRRNCTTAIPQGNVVAVMAFIKLFNTFLSEFRPTEVYKPRDFEEREIVGRLEGFFLFSVMWTIGGTLSQKDRLAFNSALVEAINHGRDRHKLSISLPERRSLYDCTFSVEKDMNFIDWLETLPDFVIPENAQYHEIIVPTADTERYNFLMRQCIHHNLPCLLVGDTGTGKTLMAKSLLSGKLDKEIYISNMIQFSAQTSANQTQDMLEGKLNQRRKGVFGPPLNKKLIIFLDDINMPMKEEYGAQPPIELLRQWLDYGGWYNHLRDNVDFRRMEDSQFLAAMGPPGGGRSELTPRFTRHFNTVSVPAFDDTTLKKIFQCLMDWIVTKGGYASGMRQVVNPAVAATVEVYNTLVEKLKPTPEKSHYTFNLRDMSKVFQGISMAAPAKIQDTTKMYRLWVHEMSRAFADRFVDEKDTQWFLGVLNESMTTHFRMNYKAVAPPTDGPLLFADFLESRAYEEVDDMTVARKSLEDTLDLYNSTVRGGGMNLVIFNYVIEHVARICRILKQPFGSALLIGVGGSGRSSCSKLAAKIQDYDYFTVTLTKDFKRVDFWDAIKALLLKCGKDGIPTVFALSDTQITQEVFLEDVSNLLNTGEVPGLFPPDELDQAAQGLRTLARDSGRDFSTPSLIAFFVERCRIYLHMVLCFSPVGKTLRERLRKFPSLVNCTTIDWFRDWPEEGLRNVAARFLSDMDLTDAQRISCVECCVFFQESVRELAAVYKEEARVPTYVTPTSYLELLGTFQSLLQIKHSQLKGLRDRYDNGLEQLSLTRVKVTEMEAELTIAKPQLEIKKAQTEVLITQVSKKTEEAEIERAKVAQEERQANEVASTAKSVKDQCDQKMAEAQPKLDAAKRAAEQIDENDLRLVKTLKEPNKKWFPYFEAVCCLLGGPYKPPPKRNPQTGKVEYDWFRHSQKELLASTSEMKRTLGNFTLAVGTTPPEQLKSQMEEARAVTLRESLFNSKDAKSVSSAAAGLVDWCLSTIEYYDLEVAAQPLRKALREAEDQYTVAMATLSQAMESLRKVDEEVANQKAHLDGVKNEMQQLQARVALTDAKLGRAKKLIDGLGGEGVRYEKESVRYSAALANVLGDVLVSSAQIAYLGPFQNKYRQRVIVKWVDLCVQKAIPITSPFVFEKFLGNPVEIQQSKLKGLPSDTFSVENAIIMQNSRRWPLLIDPQQQANKWIRNKERNDQTKKDLVVVRPTEGDYAKTLSNAVRQGLPCLLENVEEDLDPVLENLLLKRYVKEGTGWTVTIGDPVEINLNFRLYITTKLPRPHYRPEVSTKVNIINFMITPDGLQDQLLQKVVLHERRDVEEKRQHALQEAAKIKEELQKIEDTILALLNAEGDLLENEQAVVELDRAKEQSERGQRRQKDIEAAEAAADKARRGFIPAAALGSTLFFCVSELANIDPMYQYSLQFYMALFQTALHDSEKDEDPVKRVGIIVDHFQTQLYTRICRSLFAKDQLLFSFTMCIRIFKVDPLEVRWLLVGGLEQDRGLVPNPCSAWLPDLNWKLAWRASTQLPAFEKLQQLITANQDALRTIYQAADPLDLPWPGELAQFTEVHRLILMRIFRTDKMVGAVQQYVNDRLGKTFVQPALYNLEAVVDELSHDTSVPIIFVLSPGADPNSELERVATIKGMLEKKLFKLSLGQGQDVPAKALITEAKKAGNWVLLQNCHLYKDFMPTMARIIEDYSRDDVKGTLHKDFRLWLTSLPSETFPVSVLQNGVKLVLEPPKGLRSNLLKSYTSDPIADQKFFHGCNKADIFRKLLFGLCFFHSLVQERRHFGPLGWNIPYEFNDTDMRISVRQLQMFINENADVPYEALTYLTGHCNYGGRVTDDWDRTCLIATLGVFFNASILEDNYRFNGTQEYFAPPYGEHDAYVSYIENLPLLQKPQVFGLHPNADITKDEREARLLMDATLQTQPRESSGSNAVDPKTIVQAIAKDVFSRLPPSFNIEDVKAKYPLRYDNSMNTVLLQELIRYNKLLGEVRSALFNLQKAIKGEVVMSSDLEDVFNSMYDSKIPKKWLRVSYPSLKPFGAYINDLLARLDFLKSWIDRGPPSVFWISGFFFTQSFLTGVMQNYARKYRIEIDKLIWDFTVMHEADYAEPPKDGCYVNGLFLEGAGWDHDRKLLCESKPKQLFVTFPIVYLKPLRQEESAVIPHYKCPTYKTTDRRGVLSTTGHSTNFVMPFKLPRDAELHDENHWVLRGAALFTQLEY